MKDNNIIIIGGNGKTGRKVAERMTARGQKVRIASRSTNPAFDWNDNTTWADALEGMDMVYITYQPDLAVPGAAEAIEAFTAQAVSSGIRKMVLLSGRGEVEAQRCEQIFLGICTTGTVVRADWFFQNFSENFLLEPVLAGHIALPRADTPVAFIDTGDIADVVVESLLNDAHNGKIHELTGPRLLTFPEASMEISTATGREIRFEPVSLANYRKTLVEAGLPDDYVWLIDYLFTHVYDGRNASTTNTIEEVLGRQARDFKDYAKEMAATGIWNIEVPHTN